MRKKVTQYSSGTKILHWIIALLVLVMVPVGFFLSELAKPIQPISYMFHKSIGLTILVLMMMRILWMLYKGRPTLPLTIPKWERALSHFVQYSLYVLLIAMPLSGWIFSVADNRIPVYFGLFKVPIPSLSPNEAVGNFFYDCHRIIAWLLVVLISLHICGALKHYLVDKDKVMERMLPRSKD